MASVLALPDFDVPTRSASGFLLRYVVPRMEPLHLFGPLDTGKLFNSALARADLVIATGHGLPGLLTGQHEEPLLESGSITTSQVKGKMFRFLSCQNGRELGPALVEHGALAFIGYVDDYVWVADADKWMTPWADRYAERFLLPVMQSINALLDGETLQASYMLERELYEANARQEDDDLMRGALRFNRDNLVLLGQAHLRVRSRPRISLPVPPPPVIVPVRKLS